MPPVRCTIVPLAHLFSLPPTPLYYGRRWHVVPQGTSTASLWIRNIQLGSFSLLLGVIAVVGKDSEAVSSRGFFAGYSPMVWLCISLNSLGGLAVAVVVKYADNLVRVRE